MTSQISQIYMRKPIRTTRARVLRAAGAIGGVLAIGTAAAWLFNLAGERPLAARTRQRLVPRAPGPLVVSPVAVSPVEPVSHIGVVPNAADIHVA